MPKVMATIEETIRDPNRVKAHLKQHSESFDTCNCWIFHMPDYDDKEWDEKHMEAKLKSCLREVTAEELSRIRPPRRTQLCTSSCSYLMHDEDAMSCEASKFLNAQLMKILERDLPATRMLYNQIVAAANLRYSAPAKQMKIVLAEW
eukprot:CAMPEP_0114502898 /NCGR_PEP_ID=MMETSP0109-20121206/9354_1 /TAXON_ID=29199 /ORGANISM="Chlorarachnion reptans, Strain CCCM449" /LENGTH=146 /DNA_ID=CAMNT_0001680879 /DNA_START=1094 /DNA_END=1531 /DNA_ORIENTATION=+